MLLMLGLFFVLLVLGVPIVFVLCFPAIIYLMVYHPNLLPVVPLKMFRGLSSYTLLALPFFILAGNVMSRSGITEKLVEFSDQLVGRFRGGLAHVNVVTSTFFAGISGAALADTASLGAIFIPAMEKKGYDINFSCAITASSAVQSPLIPPSLSIVVYAAITGTSVGALFLAGIVPGLLIGLTDHIYIYIVATKRDWPRNLDKMNLTKLISAFADALPALIMPAIILGGILGGLTTPTEAAALAVIYALLVSIFYYRTLSVRQLPGILKDTLITCSMLAFVLAGSRTMSWVLEMEGIPLALTNFLFSVSPDIRVTFILLNIVLFVAGCVIESHALLILLAPILVPIMINMGVSPVHFGIFFLLNIVLGMITPPVGFCNFAAATIGRTSVEGVSKAIIPLVLLDVVVLLVVTYIPETVLFLPGLFGFTD